MCFWPRINNYTRELLFNVTKISKSKIIYDIQDAILFDLF